MNQLIERLKSYKDDNDLSYRQLSSITNVSATALYRYMVGERNLTIDFCKAVSEILELELTEALEMGGLLTNKKQGDQAEAQSPRFAERHNGSIPNKSTN